MNKQAPMEEEKVLPEEEKVIELEQNETEESVPEETKKKWWESVTENKPVMIVLSVLISVILWVAVSMNTYTEESVTVYDVPVTYSLPAAAENLGLSIVEKNVDTVNVTITGNRYIVGQIKSGMLRASVQPSNVKSAGIYTIPIVVESVSDSLNNFEVTKMSYNYASVRLDRVIDKEFTLVHATLNEYQAETGFELGAPVLGDKVLTISGPQTDLTKIARVVAEARVDDAIKSTTTYQANITLYDSDGNRIEYATEEKPELPIKVGFASTEMTIIAYKEVAVPVVVDYLNPPTGDRLPKATYSPATLQVLVPVDLLGSLKEINVGSIDFSTIKAEDVSRVFSVLDSIPDGCDLRSEETSVQFSLDLSDMMTRTFTVTNFVLTDSKRNTAKITTKSLLVTLTGPKDVMQSLTADQISAEVDLKDVTGKGSQEVPVSIVVQGSEDCWAFGSPKVWVTLPN